MENNLPDKEKIKNLKFFALSYKNLDSSEKLNNLAHYLNMLHSDSEIMILYFYRVLTKIYDYYFTESEQLLFDEYISENCPIIFDFINDDSFIYTVDIELNRNHS